MNTRQGIKKLCNSGKLTVKLPVLLKSMLTMKLMQILKGENYMLVSGEAFSQRLATFSDSTIKLIMKLSINRETSKRVNLIVQNTDYSEKQVVEKLLEIEKEIKDT